MHMQIDETGCLAGDHKAAPTSGATDSVRGTLPRTEVRGMTAETAACSRRRGPAYRQAGFQAAVWETIRRG